MYKKYIDYFPPVLKGITEIKTIGDAFDRQLEIIVSWKDYIQNEMFVDTAINEGLKMREEALDIVVAGEEDVELRRFNIKAKLMGLTTHIPEAMDTLVGKGNYTMVYDPVVQKLNITLSLYRKDFLNAVENMLDEMLPLQIELNTTLAYNTHEILSRHTREELAEYTHSELVVKEGL